MFLFVAFLIFSGALLAAAWYVYSVPQQEETRYLSARLREIRAPLRRQQKLARCQRADDPGESRHVRRHRGLRVVARPRRRIQEYIEQANMKYKASDVLTVSVLLVARAFTCCWACSA